MLFLDFYKGMTCLDTFKIKSNRLDSMGFFLLLLSCWEFWGTKLKDKIERFSLVDSQKERFKKKMKRQKQPYLVESSTAAIDFSRVTILTPAKHKNMGFKSSSNHKAKSNQQLAFPEYRISVSQVVSPFEVTNLKFSKTISNATPKQPPLSFLVPQTRRSKFTRRRSTGAAFNRETLKNNWKTQQEFYVGQFTDTLLYSRYSKLKQKQKIFCFKKNKFYNFFSTLNFFLGELESNFSEKNFLEELHFGFNSRTKLMNIVAKQSTCPQIIEIFILEQSEVLNLDRSLIRLVQLGRVHLNSELKAQAEAEIKFDQKFKDIFSRFFERKEMSFEQFKQELKETYDFIFESDSALDILRRSESFEYFEKKLEVAQKCKDGYRNNQNLFKFKDEILEKIGLIGQLYTDLMTKIFSEILRSEVYDHKIKFYCLIVSLTDGDID